MLSFHFIFSLLFFSSRLHCSVSSSRSSVCSHHPTVYLTACSEHGHLTYPVTLPFIAYSFTHLLLS